MATENRHIEQIYNTRSNLQSNLDNGQIGIETDGTEPLVYKDDDGTYHIVANTAEAASFTNLTATGNLTIAAAMYHSGDADTYFTFADDQATIVCGGVSMIDFLETTQDVITVNSGSADVDFIVKYNGGTASQMYGSNGMTIYGGVGSFDPSSGSTSYAQLLLQGGTAGDQAYTPALGFFSGANTVARSAICGVQGSSDADQLGIAFFTHPSATGADALIESMKLSYNGDLYTTQNIYLSDDKYIGILSGARLVFDATATPDSITVTDADLWVGDGKYIGLGAAKGRILFTDTTVDTFTIKDADIYMDGEKANIIGVAQSVTDTAGNSLTIHAGAAKATTADLAGGELILTPGQSTGTGIAQTTINRRLRAPSTGTSGNNTASAVIVAPTKHLTNNTAIDLFDISLGTLQGSGGQIAYTCQVDNGTDVECHSGFVVFAAARKGATYQTAISEGTAVSGLEDECHTTVSAMTDTWSMTSGSGKATVRTLFNSGMSGTLTMTLHMTIFNNSLSTITLL